MLDVTETQGAPITSEVLREQYLSSGATIVTKAFERMQGDMPPILEFRVLWIIETDNRALVRKLRSLWNDYADGITVASDKPTMQALFDKLVLDVAAIAVVPDAALQIAPPVAKIQPLPHDQWPAPPDRPTLENSLRGHEETFVRIQLREWLKYRAYPPEAVPHLRGDSSGDTLSKVSTADLMKIMYGELPAPAVDRVPGLVEQPKVASREIPPFTSEAATPPDDLSFFAVMDAGQLIQWMVDNLWSGDANVLNTMPIDKPWTAEELMAKLGEHYGWV